MHVLDACSAQEIDVVLVQDLPQAVDTEPRSHQGYQFIGATVPQGTHREAGVFVNPRVRVTRSPESSPRAVGVELSWRNSTIGFISGYIQPETAVGLADLAGLSQVLKARTPFVFIGADINGHSPSWGPLETTPNAQGLKVEDFILEEGLEVLNCPNSLATFMPSIGRETWIDVSLATRQLASLVAEWGVLDQYFHTDHRAIRTEFSVVPMGTSQHRTFNWKAADWERLNRMLEAELVARSCQPKPPSTTQELDSLVANFSSALGQAVAVAVPVKRPSRFSKPWWNPTLTRLQRATKKAYYHWKWTLWEGDRALFAAKRWAYKNEIAAAKKRLWVEFCEGMTQTNAWERLKKIDGQPRRRQVGALKDSHGEWAHDAGAKAQVLGAHFFPQDSRPITEAQRATIDDVIHWLGEHPAESNTLPPVSAAEVQASLLHFRALGAPGSDGIMNEVLRRTMVVSLPFITAIAQSSMQLQYFPRAWKRAIAILVPKKGCDLEEAGSYRPISLLSVVGKVVEFLVTKRLTFWLEAGKKLSKNQYGFRKQKGVELAL